MYRSNLYVKDLREKLANIATVYPETNVRCKLSSVRVLSLVLCYRLLHFSMHCGVNCK